MQLIGHLLSLGVDKEGVLRSLPLPNLSKVTRESAREYFDNSWTLFEVCMIHWPDLSDPCTI